MEIVPRKGVISGANMGRPMETSGGLSTIGNSHCAAASSQLSEFLEPQARWAFRACRLGRGVGVCLAGPATRTYLFAESLRNVACVIEIRSL